MFECRMARRDLRMATVCLAVLAALLLGAPTASFAQVGRATSPGPRSEAALDLSLFSGALSYARRVAPGHYLGLGLGGGLERLDVTLAPSTGGDRYHPFDQYIHLSAFYRNRPTDRREFETGLRSGVSELRVCRVSDCIPGTFIGAYTGFFWGGHRLKLGHRLLAAINRETGTGARDFVLHLDLVAVRVTF